ncbi:MAG: hypothetical protein COB50_04760 [Thiotrichales bacterium]|nr:MAG: hypothetical protein COB50_04760 [Thiotrichales bacterium]
MQNKKPNTTILSHLSALHIKGPDANTFLQGQLTCDIQTVSCETSVPFSYCNLQGRMETLGSIIKTVDGFVLCVPQEILPTALEKLKKYGMFSKVKFIDDNSYAFMGITGEHAEHILCKHFTKIPKNYNGTICGNDIHVICVSQHRFLLMGNIEKIKNLYGNLQTDDTTPVDINKWNLSCIQDNAAFLTKDSIGKFLPQEINLEQQQGLSFNKGCFLGQEVIARVHHLGKLKQELRQITITTDITQQLAGKSIHTQDHKPAGKIICSAILNNTQQLCLASVMGKFSDNSQFVV